MKERRRIVLQKSVLRGNIQFNHGRNTVDCLIRDITVYGARLVCSDPSPTPDVIDVYIPQKDQTFRAHVIWRNAQELGVAFAQVANVQPMQGAADSSLDLSGRVERLEAELTAIKRLLRKLRADGGPDTEVA